MIPANEILPPPGKSKAPNGYWTKERCATAAQKHSARTVFARCEPSAYNAAKVNRWLEDVCQHMVRLREPHNTWTKTRCAKEAAKFSTKTEFRKGAYSAWVTALRAGWLPEMCGHMTAGCQASSNDCFYLWRAAGATFNGLPVYKYGVTSTRLGLERIEEVAVAGGLEYDVVIWTPVADARAIEAQVKRMGVNPEYAGFNGCTEFRALADAEVARIKALATAGFTL